MDEKPFAPVQAVPGKSLGPPIIQLDLNSVAVVLDFVEVISLGRFCSQRCELGLDEARHFRTWERLTHSGLKPCVAISFLTRSTDHLQGGRGIVDL